MIILFKYCAGMENCESFRGFYYIYIYRLVENYWKWDFKKNILLDKKKNILFNFTYIAYLFVVV